MVPRAALAAALVTGVLLSSCQGKKSPTAEPGPAPQPTEVKPAAPLPSAPVASATATAAPDGLDAGVDGGKSAAAASSAKPDAGPAASASAEEDCKLVRGPAQLSFTGPAAFVFAGSDKGPGDVRVVFNREGSIDARPPVFKELVKPGGGLLPGAKKPELVPKAPLVPEASPAQERASGPGCAVAGDKIFCMDKEGAIRRRLASGEGDKVVGQGRPGTPLAAVPLGAEHTFVALLANQKTTEGIITQAFTILDDGPSILLSEEGSGATFVTLMARERDVLAMYIDSRVALTPMHARTLSVSGGKLKLGRDAVIFMGGGGDRRQSGAMAWSGKGPAYALIATTDHDNKYGMAAVPIGDEPKDDTPAVWSYYPTEITQAPIAATVGVSPVRVARVRSVSAEAGSWRVLELGHLDDSGHFRALCNLVESRSFTDVAIAVSPAGSIWIVYTSADGTWVEQRGKP